jgi:hypothetical protein
MGESSNLKGSGMNLDMRSFFGFPGLTKVLSGLFLASFATAASAANIEQETLKRLDQLRAIETKSNRKSVDQYNIQMDQMWAFFLANKKSVLPVLRRELAFEIKQGRPNNLFLLDIGYFLRLQEATSDKNLGKEALFKLDTTADTVRSNKQQLFSFSHAVVPDRDPRTLAFLDKTFLRDKVTAFIPQHALNLDETLVCVFLYGIYGQAAETHLGTLLGDRTVTNRVLEILTWLGSPDSVPAVRAAMTASRSHDTFARGTAFMMKAGGARGRAAMLEINPREYDAKSQEYYGKIRKDIEATTYEALREQFSGLPGTPKLSADEVKKRLSAMYENYGKDTITNPVAILNSGLPRQYLTGELTRIRERMFYRLSDEALSDVAVTNMILNALHYR